MFFDKPFLLVSLHLNEENTRKWIAEGGAQNSQNILTLHNIINSDQFRFVGNYPPTAPLSQHFALSEK